VQPHWSPHGHRIAYWHYKGGQRDLVTVPASGGEPIAVTNDAALDWNPVWSPDGRFLYFASDGGGSMNLWRVPIEEKSGKVLGPAEAVTTPSVFSGHLGFSRDGRLLAYSQRSRTANAYRVAFDANTGETRGQRVAVTEGSREVADLNISPDGSWLAFFSYGKQWDIFVVRSDGTGLRQVTNDVFRDRRPTWSPDGKRIAFHSTRSGKYQIWSINADGSGLRQLTDTRGEVRVPTWSPDGKRIVCLEFPGPKSFMFNVTKPWKEQSPESLPDRAGAQFVAWSWSPDGRRLAGHQIDANGREAEIILYSFETREFEKPADFGVRPIWLKDNRRLLFHSDDRIYLLDSKSKKVGEVLSVAPNSLGDGITISPDNRVLYFSLQQEEADIWLATLR